MKFIWEIWVQHCNPPIEELNHFLRNNGFESELMIAHFFNGEPHIFIADFINGFVCPAASKNLPPFAAIGTGAKTAQYILGKLDIRKIDSTDHATNIMVTSMYVVEEVKRVDTYCGGSMILGVVHSNNDATLLPPGEGMEMQIKYIKQADKNSSGEWSEKIEKMIASVIKSVQAEQRQSPEKFAR